MCVVILVQIDFGFRFFFGDLRLFPRFLGNPRLEYLRGIMFKTAFARPFEATSWRLGFLALASS